MRAVGVGAVDEIAQRPRPVNPAAAFVRGSQTAKGRASTRTRGVVAPNASLRSACPSAITAVCTKTPLRSYPAYSLQACAAAALSPRDVERLCATQCSRSNLARDGRQLLDKPGAGVAGRHRAAKGRRPLAEPRRIVPRGRYTLRERQQLRRRRQRALRPRRVRGRLTRLGPLPRRARGDRARRRRRAGRRTRARLPAARVSIRVPW